MPTQSGARGRDLVFAGLDDARVVGYPRFLQRVLGATQALVVGLGRGVDDGQQEIGHHHQHHFLKHPGEYAASLSTH